MIVVMVVPVVMIVREVMIIVRVIVREVGMIFGEEIPVVVIERIICMIVEEVPIWLKTEIVAGVIVGVISHQLFSHLLFLSF